MWHVAAYCLHLAGLLPDLLFDPEDVGDTFPRNVSKILLIHIYYVSVKESRGGKEGTSLLSIGSTVAVAGVAQSI
jgi:hypothetical protein